MDICQKLVEVQRSAWQMADIDILPAWKLFLTPKLGSHIIVAFDGDEAVGFAMLTHSISENDGDAYLYLDLIGVSQKYQSHQLGFKIMREACKLLRGKKYSHVAWTYDPLEGANANLYIRKLGAIVTKYYENYYGELTGERHRGTATDRFLAVWYPNAKTKTIEPDETITEKNFSSLSKWIQQKKIIGIEIPADFSAIRNQDPSRAQNIRLSTRKTFQELLHKGYIISGFQRKGDKNIYIAQRQ